MALKTRRQGRYTRLRLAGFLPFEARPLSNVLVPKCPYLAAILADRREEFKRAQKTMTAQQYEVQIKLTYAKNGWVRRNKKGQVVADPWKMLRDFEDRYKQKNPEYDSPWEKRWRDWKDFLGKYEKTVAKQRGAA